MLHQNAQQRHLCECAARQSLSNYSTDVLVVCSRQSVLRQAVISAYDSHSLRRCNSQSNRRSIYKQTIIPAFLNSQHDDVPCSQVDSFLGHCQYNEQVICQSFNLYICRSACHLHVFVICESYLHWQLIAATVFLVSFEAFHVEFLCSWYRERGHELLLLRLHLLHEATLEIFKICISNAFSSVVYIQIECTNHVYIFSHVPSMQFCMFIFLQST